MLCSYLYSLSLSLRLKRTIGRKNFGAILTPSLGGSVVRRFYPSDHLLYDLRRPTPGLTRPHNAGLRVPCLSLQPRCPPPRAIAALPSRCHRRLLAPPPSCYPSQPPRSQDLAARAHGQRITAAYGVSSCGRRARPAWILVPCAPRAVAAASRPRASMP